MRLLTVVLLLVFLPPVPLAAQDAPLGLEPPSAEQEGDPPLSPLDESLFAPLAPLESLADIDVSDIVPAREPDQPRRLRLNIEGLEETDLLGEWRLLSTLWRDRNQSLTPLELANRLRTEERLLKDLLASEGWFDAGIDSRTDIGAETAEVLIEVRPGPRYRWGEIAIDAVPEDRPELAAEFPLMPGATLRLSEVEEAEARYKLVLADAGYPFADLGPRDIVLDEGTRTGDYLLTGLLGRPAVFGEIRLTDHQPFRDEHAEVIARFRKGEPWSGALLDDFRRAMIATRLFSGLVVTPVDTGQVDAEGRGIADIEVSGQQAPRRSLAGQAGYSTDEGIRAEARWQNRNIWKPEGALTVSGVVGTIEQRVGANVRKSNFGRRDRFLLMGLDFANQNLPAFDARLFRIGAAIGRESTAIWQKRWVWEAGAEAIYTRERDKGVPVDDDTRDSYSILALPGGGGYDGTDDLLDPTRGFRVSLRISPEASLQRNNFEAYVRMIGDASTYWQALDSLILAGRVRLGSIVGTERQNIAPSRRLYAGGGGSVRGYTFQGVGPRTQDSEGAFRPIGGRGLFETSVEARYRFGDFGLVAFVDAGQLEEGPRPGFDDLRFGAGLGARYYTSFGPLRVDLARGINRREGDPQVVLYISIGQAF
ncbi:MAG: BamA/TamA family outer membrane protein [Sphingomonadaceae bacterium]